MTKDCGECTQYCQRAPLLTKAGTTELTPCLTSSDQPVTMVRTLPDNVLTLCGPTPYPGKGGGAIRPKEDRHPPPPLVGDLNNLKKKA